MDDLTRPPASAGIVLCRRALCDSDSGQHSLIDVLIDLAVPVCPGAVTFDLYLLLRRIGDGSNLVIEVFDRAGVVLSTGKLALAAAPASVPGPPPPALGVVIPRITTVFTRPGYHWLRVRAGEHVLGEHGFVVVETGEGAA